MHTNSSPKAPSHQKTSSDSSAKSQKEKEQDIKNAAYLASMNQPNHPNT